MKHDIRNLRGDMPAIGRSSRGGVVGAYAFPGTQPSPQMGEHAALSARPHQGRCQKRQSRLAVLTFCLYLATISVDAVRKAAGLPASVIGVIYVITAVIYIVAIPGAGDRRQAFPRALPILLCLMSVWCLTVAVLQNISPETALLGWASYVFFVPLLYVGAELAADNTLVPKGLRIIVISGGLVALGAIGSVALGGSAPSVLQPIVPAVGVHTFGTESIYLAPSFFATAEEAGEQLLIASFAWVALIRVGNGGKGRVPLAFLGILIASGLIATARRTDIYVAVAGIIVVLLLGSDRAPRRRMVGSRSRLGAAAFIAIAGAVAVVPFLGGAELVSFLISGSAWSRISIMFALPGADWLVGQGPGTATQGVTVIGAAAQGPALAPYASYVLNNQTFVGAEGSLPKTWLELGIMGAALYGAIFWEALAPAVRSLRRLDGPALAFTMLAIALGVVFLKGHPSLDDPLIQPLFWLAVGGIWGRMHVAANDVRAASIS
jgi:hypothetical protein